MNPKVVLLHGALGCAKQLDPLSEFLKARGFDCLSLDFSGHGTASKESGFGIDHFAKQFLSFLKENEIDRANVFGYSMGGYAALKAIQEEPNSIQKLVCLGTKFDWNPQSAEIETRKLDADKIFEKVPAFATHLEHMHGSSWKSLLDKTAAMMRDLGEKPALGERELGAIKAPVRLLRAELDNMVSKAETMQAAALLPNAAFSTVPDMPHPIEKVDQEKLADLISPFFLPENQS